MTYNLLIKEARIIDGAGGPWFRGDIAIEGGNIAEVGRLGDVEAERVIKAEGLIAAPGFIDPHSHADAVAPVFPEMESTVMQGITTIIAGNCGSSLAPVNPELRELMERQARRWLPPELELRITWTTFDEYLTEMERRRLGVNMAHLVGHGSIRVAAMGYEARDPTAEELEEMKRLTAEAMEAGAFGLSTGLIYPPGCYAKTEEIIELAKVAARYGGVYASHIRGEGKTLLEALREALRIGEETGIPVQISHHKAASREMWGKSVETLRMMEEARKRGLDITFDQYPYRAGATSLATLLPPWAHEGGMEKLLERLKEPELRERMRRDIERGLPGWENFVEELGWENIYISHVKTERNKMAEGKNLMEVKELRGDPDEFTTLYNLLLEEEGAVGMIIFAMDEEDVRRMMKHPLQMVGTDALSASPKGPMSHGKPHPRYYGTYPRVLGRYVRELGLLPWEEAIRKMTSAPAQRFGLWDRGLLRPGFKADIVLFDPDTIIDRATFEDPHRFPEGIKYVIVNGVVEVDRGDFTGELGGKTLRKR